MSKDDIVGSQVTITVVRGDGKIVDFQLSHMDVAEVCVIYVTVVCEVKWAPDGISAHTVQTALALIRTVCASFPKSAITILLVHDSADGISTTIATSTNKPQ